MHERNTWRRRSRRRRRIRRIRRTYEETNDSRNEWFNLNTCLVHKLRHFRKYQISRTNSKWICGIIVASTRLICLIGAQGLTEDIIGPIAIGGWIMMIVRGASSRDVQQQRWSWTVERWNSGSPVAGFMILRLVDICMAALIRELQGVQRAICRVFVNVCEVR